VTRDPDGVQVVASGETIAVTVTAEAGHTLQSAVGGTCPPGSWNGAVYTTGAVTAECTVSFSAFTVFMFVSNIYKGTDVGDRTAAAAKCQAAHDQVNRGLSNLACNHYVPLLGYAPNGVTDLTQAPYLVPTNRKFVGPSGTAIADDWNTLVNMSNNVNDVLGNAGVLTSSQANSLYAWTGFTTGGAVTDHSCEGWTGTGNGSYILRDLASGWAGSPAAPSPGRCDSYILPILCMCWHD
jgi:hypothetical protein